jgi:plastocyanin domain-containing protein
MRALFTSITRGRSSPGDDPMVTREVRVRVAGGYHPDTVRAAAGVPLRIVFRREESSACSEQVVFPAFGKCATLPQGEDVAVDLTPEEPGIYEFTCAMNMLHGALVISPHDDTTGHIRRPAAQTAVPTPVEESLVVGGERR